MKQTSNALTFLMAQYRAIFKNAYFKGIATAAIVTAGLAVGSANAAKTGEWLDQAPESGAASVVITSGTEEILQSGRSTKFANGLTHVFQRNLGSDLSKTA